MNRLIITFDLDDMARRGLGNEIGLILRGLADNMEGMTAPELRGMSVPLLDSRGQAVGLVSKEVEE